jgi:hypothetical protein
MFHQSRQTLKHSLALELRRLRYGRPQQKVFCVGFQKTGTTSLQYALSLLGYRVAGIFSVKDLNDFDQARAHALDLMQGFDAAGDNPWSVLFRDLDVAFPGSKFILTTRDPNRWYESACEHFGAGGTQIREWIYGAASPKENRTAYIDRLERHAAEVRTHFAGRTADFMEFDVAKGDSWGKLCNLLGKPVPRRNFPRLNTVVMRGG